MTRPHPCLFFFFFNDTATTEIYTLSLHDALPICDRLRKQQPGAFHEVWCSVREYKADRKSTRLNSSHTVISYAVFCLKKKNYANLANFSRGRQRGPQPRRLHTCTRQR